MSVFFFNVTKNKQYSENYLILNADAIADIYKSARDIFASVRDILRKYESARDIFWKFGSDIFSIPRDNFQ